MVRADLGIPFLLFALVASHGVRSEFPKVLNASFGWLQTPTYPEEYENDQNLTWVIEVRKGFRIKLQFTAFDVEDSYDEDLGGSCVYDYVTVSEGAKSLGRFCGNSKMRGYDSPALRRWMYTEQNMVTINFVTDFSNDDMKPMGFKAHYVEIDIDECAVLRKKQMFMTEDWDKLVTCNHFCHNVPGSYYCTCKYGFSLHENNHTCVATFCENQTLTEESGVIESPDYPGSYAKLSHCSWTIRVETGLGIQLAFDKEFAIESHFEEGCVYDKLTITNKNKTTLYCGGTAPEKGSLMDMQSKEVTIQFDTDLAIEMKGFRITYNTTKIRCLDPISNSQDGSLISHMSKEYHEFRDVVQFSCDRGYDLIGEENITCRNDGTWDRPAPKCRVKSCGVPRVLLTVPNSHIVNYTASKTKYLDVVNVECDTWYKMVAGTANWICQNDKKWIQNGTAIAPPRHNLPECKPVCGKKGKGMALRTQMSGGVKTEKNEFPWVVLLTFGSQRYTRIEDSYLELCGGSLISPHHVLTAAHCVRTDEGYTKLPNESKVWIGVHDRLHPEKSGAKGIGVSNIIIHPLYSNASKWDFDVALLRLNQTVTMTDEHRTICLPSTTDEFEMATPVREGVVAGWGSFDRSRRTSMDLLQAEFPVVDGDMCWKALQNYAKESDNPLPADLKLTENMFCAGIRHSQMTCQGDSGGPFMMKNENRTYYQVGAVSFGLDGNACGKHYLYSVYAKLNQDIVQWIMDTTNNLE